jgi:hypothetical protein
MFTSHGFLGFEALRSWISATTLESVMSHQLLMRPQLRVIRGQRQNLELFAAIFMRTRYLLAFF